MIIVFAKVLRGSAVKTRLQRTLSPQDALTFYVASLADTLEAAEQAADSVALYLDGGEDSAAVGDLYSKLRLLGLPDVHRFEAQPQRGQNLGERMERAFADARQPALLVGSDSPTLHPSMLRRGLTLLTDRVNPVDAVLGPAVDGGFWCVGLRSITPGLFDGVAWSTDRALSETQAQIVSHGFHTQLIDTCADVDTHEDLGLVARQIETYRRRGDASTARFTERAFKQLGLLR